MNKIEMVDKVAEQFGITKKDAEEMVMFILDTCVRSALNDGRVRIGSHRFERYERAAREGRNPRTGEVIKIPQKIKVTYRNVNL